MNLKEFCLQVRRDIVQEIGTFGVGHIGGSFSIVEILAVLYKNYMNFDPKNPKKESRDRLIVSKGHSGPAVYAVLANLGFFDKSWLLNLNKPGTNLPSHCDMNKTPGIDMTTGSLGQGFSCAVGIALGSKLKNDKAKIYTIIGDGESQEGQIWEATMFASHNKLDNLIAFLDYNGAQIDGKTNEVCSIEPVAEKWKAFGWHVIEVKNGNSCEEINDALKIAQNIKNKPCIIIAKTVKGYGVSFIEKAGVDNHSMNISKEQLELALEELKK
ncbi:MAG: transketolase [Clostridia bacterium]|nr:transketolase [Clostridia bacterium]